MDQMSIYAGCQNTKDDMLIASSYQYTTKQFHHLARQRYGPERLCRKGFGASGLQKAFLRCMVRGFNYLDQDVATTFRKRSRSSENEKLMMTSDIGAITRQRHLLIGCAFLGADAN